MLLIRATKLKTDLKSKLHERIRAKVVLLYIVSAKLVKYNVIDIKL